jgi:hypothetical protein
MSEPVSVATMLAMAKECQEQVANYANHTIEYLRKAHEGIEQELAGRAAEPMAPEFHWRYSHHYTAENIAEIVRDLRQVEGGTESIEWFNRDHRTKAGILWRVISALSYEVPTASRPMANEMTK